MINFLDLKQINNKYLKEFKIAYEKVIDSGYYINGQEVEMFEKEFANFCGTKYCIAVGNGLDALSISLETWKIQGKIKSGDEVIVPSNTFIASILSIIHSGLVPVLVDHDLRSHNIDTSKILNAISEKTKVIMPVHLYGNAADMKSIMNLAQTNNLLVLEDSAQAHGAEIDGKKVGCWGDASAFSFYPGKNLGALGDAGAITTNDDKFYAIAKSYSNYGSCKKYTHDYPGVNSRLDELQAAFLRIKLKDLKNEINERRRIANIYLKNIDNANISLPEYKHKSSHVFHLFVITTDKRDALKDYLEKNDIETLIHYPKNISDQLAMDKVPYKDLASYSICNKVLSLPIGSHLSEESIDFVVNKLNRF